MNGNLDKYIKTKIALRRLTTQMRDIEAEILKEMEPGDHYTSNLGTVSIGTRKTWKYSDKCKEVIKAIKADEREKGYGEEVETTFVRYNKPGGL